MASVIIEKADELDGVISESAPQWPVDKLNRIDLAILRLATYELINTETPPKVVIDEAVELAKEYGGENSPSIGTEVIIANPFALVTADPKTMQRLASFAPLYSVAVGLAMRGD